MRSNSARPFSVSGTSFNLLSSPLFPLSTKPRATRPRISCPLEPPARPNILNEVQAPLPDDMPVAHALPWLRRALDHAPVPAACSR